MANAYTQLYFHIVFSTADRASIIDKNIDSQIYRYIYQIAENNGFNLIIGNGTKDHVHLLCSLPARIALSEAARIIKGSSSKWIHDTLGNKEFAWQGGYSAFSVSHSSLSNVSAYIENQKDHHSKISFHAEVLALLEKHNVDFDEKYLWG